MQPKADHAITWLFPDGALAVAPAWEKLNLLAHADTIDIDLPQKCGGHAECGTCRVRILEGELTPIRHEEKALMERHAKRFGDRERLACQARPRSDVTIQVLAIVPPDLREIEEAGQD